MIILTMPEAVPHILAQNTNQLRVANWGWLDDENKLVLYICKADSPKL